MTRELTTILALVLGLQVAAAAAQGAVNRPAEAPAGFDTPTLVQNPGSKSSSDGIPEPPGDTFALDQQIYETAHDVNTGLGPVYNARSCAE